MIPIAPVAAFVLLFEADKAVVRLAVRDEIGHLRIVMAIESLSSWTQVYVMARILENDWQNASVWYNLSASLVYGVLGGIYTLHKLTAHVNETTNGGDAHLLP